MVAKGSTSAPELYLYKEMFPCTCEKSGGENIFADGSRAVFSGVWSCTSPSLLFSSAPFGHLLLRFLATVPRNFAVCLLFLPQDISWSQHKPFAAPAPLKSLGQLRCSCCLVWLPFAYSVYCFNSLGYQISSSSSSPQVTGQKNLHRSNAQLCWCTGFPVRCQCIQKLKGKNPSELDQNLKTS